MSQYMLCGSSLQGFLRVEVLVGKEIFITPDAEAILRMPRPRARMEDIWAWEWERNKTLSVIDVSSYDGEGN